MIKYYLFYLLFIVIMYYDSIRLLLENYILNSNF